MKPFEAIERPERVQNCPERLWLSRVSTPFKFSFPFSIFMEAGQIDRNQKLSARLMLRHIMGVTQRVMERIEQEQRVFDTGAFFGQPFEAQMDSSM
jgi:hypothetical protein